MNVWPRNAKVSQRMQVIDISSVTLNGVLSEQYGDTGNDIVDGWHVTDGKEDSSLTEWLDAFEGKDVIITIKLANGNDNGVSLRKQPMEPTP